MPIFGNTEKQNLQMMFTSIRCRHPELFAVRFENEDTLSQTRGTTTGTIVGSTVPFLKCICGPMSLLHVYPPSNRSLSRPSVHSLSNTTLFQRFRKRNYNETSMTKQTRNNHTHSDDIAQTQENHLGQCDSARASTRWRFHRHSLHSTCSGPPAGRKKCLVDFKSG